MTLCEHTSESLEEFKLFNDILTSHKHKTLHRDGKCDCDAFNMIIILLNHIHQCIGKENVKLDFEKVSRVYKGKMSKAEGLTEVGGDCACSMMSIYGPNKVYSTYLTFFRVYRESYTFHDWLVGRRLSDDDNQKNSVAASKLTKIVIVDFKPHESFSDQFMVARDMTPATPAGTKKKNDDKPIDELYEFVEGAEMRARAIAAEQKKREAIAEQSAKLTELNDEYGKHLNREIEIRNKIANCKTKKKKQNVTSKLTKSKIQLKEHLKAKEKIEDKITRCFLAFQGIDEELDLQSMLPDLTSVWQFIYPTEKVEEPVKEDQGGSCDGDEPVEDATEPVKETKVKKKKKKQPKPEPVEEDSEAADDADESEDDGSIISQVSTVSAASTIKAFEEIDTKKASKFDENGNNIAATIKRSPPQVDKPVPRYQPPIGIPVRTTMRMPRFQYRRPPMPQQPNPVYERPPPPPYYQTPYYPYQPAHYNPYQEAWDHARMPPSNPFLPQLRPTNPFSPNYSPYSVPPPPIHTPLVHHAPITVPSPPIETAFDDRDPRQKFQTKEEMNAYIRRWLPDAELNPNGLFTAPRK